MRITISIAVILAAMIASGSASAFERQSLGTPPQKAAPTAAPTVTPAPLAEGADTVTPKGDAGTSITIPGLGTVGVLPKLDFGMELLYGSDSSEKLEVTPDQDADGLQIRGTLKHRF